MIYLAPVMETQVQRKSSLSYPCRNKHGSLKEGTMTRTGSLRLSLEMLDLIPGLLISTPPIRSERQA